MNKKLATLDYLGNKYKIILIELSVGNFNELLNVIEHEYFEERKYES